MAGTSEGFSCEKVLCEQLELLENLQKQKLEEKAFGAVADLSKAIISLALTLDELHMYD